MKRTSHLPWIILFFVYLAIVAWICFSDGETRLELPQDLWSIPFDKCVHFLMFLPFPILGTVAFDFKNLWRTLSVTTLAALVFAFAFELLQSTINESRVTDPADLNANILGVTAGLLIVVVAGFIRKRDLLQRKRP